MANYIPIGKEQHKDATWTPFTDYTHAVSDVLVPLMVTELPRAQQSLPIAFTKGNNKVLPAAVLGIAQGKNLFVAPNGRWAGGYVPEQTKGHPLN